MACKRDIKVLLIDKVAELSKTNSISKVNTMFGTEVIKPSGRIFIPSSLIDTYWNKYNEVKNKPVTPKRREISLTPNIKPGVAELFDSNPELANEVYSALGFRQNSVEEFQGFWNRQQVATQTDKVFLFGDNTNDRTVTKYIPSTTQAVIRGLPNAIGIDTKKDRGTSTTSYLTDADFDAFKNHVDSQIKLAKDSGKTIVIPADGIGTGKAMLKEKAPKLFEYLQQELNKLKQQQITPQQKQQAISLYSEYLEQNPNGNVEQFKSWVNEFNRNKTNLEQQSENKTVSDIYKDFPYLKEFINSITDEDDNISIYNVKTILDKHGEGRIVKLNKILYNAINRLWDNNIFAKNNIKIKFVDSLPENAVGNFNRDDNEITIDKRKFLNNVINGGKNYPIFYLGYILNHEIIHYLTPKDLSLKIEYVDRALNGKFGDIFRLEHEREFGKNIKELYDIAIKELDNVEDYGFLNLAEFVAEAMSNPYFQEKLASIPFKSSKQSLWKRFVEILSAYLSLDTKKPITDTLLEAVIAETTNYITENSNIQRTYKRRKAGKTENIDIGYDFVFTTQKNINFLSDSISEKSQDFQQFQQSLNKPNTNPILQNNQQEQVKKFAELQERLSNKEFLEGAKGVYESTPVLQQLGTQEEYNDYIARVSLGIIKNPSNEEYNYTSQVKDIVYHGSPIKDLKEIKRGNDNQGKIYTSKYGITFTDNKLTAMIYAGQISNNPEIEDNLDSGQVYSVLLNIKNPQIQDFNNDSYGGKFGSAIGTYNNALEKSFKDGKDAFIAKRIADPVQNQTNIVVFEPEQIYILGGKQDIEGFKQFVSGRKNQFQKEELTQILTDAFLTRQDLANIPANKDMEMKMLPDDIKGEYDIFLDELNDSDVNPIFKGTQGETLVDENNNLCALK